MSAILVLILVTVYILMVSGIGNDIINMKVQMSETAVLKCPSDKFAVTWLGPDVINAGKEKISYFLMNQKNPQIDEDKYVIQENKGGYDLTILNFQNENTGIYICRFDSGGQFYETKYNVSLIDKEHETTTTFYTAQSFGKSSTFAMTVKTTNVQFPKNPQGKNEQTLDFWLVMIPVVLLGGCITIVGVLARVKGTTFGEMLRSFPLSCQRDTERHASHEEINEQDNTVENQMYQNSNVQPNRNLFEMEIPFPDGTDHDADLGASVDTGDTSNYRNTDESTAVQLFEHEECTPGLHYAEVLIKPVESQQIKIHGIENRTIYTGIDHALKRGTGQSDHSDNDSEDDFIYIQNLDVNSRNYENTCLK